MKKSQQKIKEQERKKLQDYAAMLAEILVEALERKDLQTKQIKK